MANDNQHLIPLEITRNEAFTMGLAPAEVRPIKIGSRMTEGLLIPAGSEEQYRTIMRELWREEQANIRSRKCLVNNGRGSLKRCTRSCSKCEKMKAGSELSLDQFYDDGNVEFSEPAANTCGTALTAVLFQELMEKLREQDPELAEIFALLYDGETQRSIARLTGIHSQSSVESKISRLRKILQQYVTRDDIFG